MNQLIYLTHRIYDSLEKGLDVCFVSLDASAAFDRVWHRGLILKLRKIGIRGPLLEWIKSYLKNRKQRVVIEGKHSQWHPVNSGVPQGSILGPLLFLIYTNDITDDIDSDILLFADDTCLLEPITDRLLSFNKINKDLQTLADWASQWLVKFNPTKTKYMIFSKKMNRPNYNPLFLQNKQLEEVKVLKHLGLTFNNKMTWDNHIDRICSDAGRRLSVIKRLPISITPFTKIHIYKTFIRPVLEYASVIFDNCTADASNKIEHIQRQAAISATRAYNKTSSHALLEECGLDPLKERCTFAKIVTFYKIKKEITPAYLHDLLPAEIRNTTDHNLRNRNNIRLPKITANYFLKSYIPSSIRLWNDLRDDLKLLTTLDTFKIHLRQIYCKTETYKPYLVGQTTGHIHLSRLRMDLSGLNAHRHKHHFIDHNICPSCNAINENIDHFLLICPVYAAQRRALLDHFERLLPDLGHSLDRLENRRNRTQIIQILTFGTKNENIDNQLLKYVAKFIDETHRF